ncbi:MAG: alpha/beta hydrolase [Sphingobacteriales bacterium]|nr:MAG: alpha/beta hydrolase [Sphingobacteriales bacterium]
MYCKFLLLITFLSVGLLSQAQTSVSKPIKQTPITIGVADEIKSQVLGENRTLNIYLPEGYSASDTSRYNVIYLLDGSMGEDFQHIAGLVQFGSMSWINWVKPSIVVGIANVDRKRDFTFPTTVKGDKEKWPTTGGSEKFITFIEQELKPYIQQRYRTNGADMLIGQSLGGLLAAQVLAKKPQLFDSYLIISPSLWWDNGSLLKATMAISPGNPASSTDIYIGVGKEGLAPTAEPHVMEVDANILADKIKSLNNKNINLHFDYLPDQNHATIMHQAVLNAFKAFSK